VTEIEASGGQYGNIDLGHGRQCQVEFISANPTGPLHMGSARNAVLGDSVASVLEAAGWQVQREYYLNDAGHADAHLRRVALPTLQAGVWRGCAARSEQHYQGEYMIDLAREGPARSTATASSRCPKDRPLMSSVILARTLVVAGIEASVERLGIHFDSWFSERSLYEDGTWDKVLNHAPRSRPDRRARRCAVAPHHELRRGSRRGVDPVERPTGLLRV
jgi:arginyl-tRNA synthetase